METIKTIDDLNKEADLIKSNYIQMNSIIQRRQYAQYFTPSEIASFMSSLFVFNSNIEDIKIFDPGAGTGILGIAVINRLLTTYSKIKHIEIVAIEIDTALNEHLKASYEICCAKCKEKEVDFSYRIVNEDFINYCYNKIADFNGESLFSNDAKPIKLFDIIILNPPYKKIDSSSESRKLLNKIGLETTNLYTAFILLSSYFIKKDGQIVAIIPRSFCNGTYFKNFRRVFFSKFFFHRIHIYNKRDKAFNEDEVLQENIIFLASRLEPESNKVLVTTSDSPEDKSFKTFFIRHDLIIRPDDKDRIIHIITDENSLKIVERISSLKQKLSDIGLEVSTGKVVDFRAKKHLTDYNNYNIAPLYYSFHFNNGKITWPVASKKKKEALTISPETEGLLITSGYYVFCKRFSSKEEIKRITAACYDYTIDNFKLIGIENHLNYFHIKNAPLSKDLAQGLTIYLNSTLVDQYFRLFNGHTQVNADDLRFIYYPSIEQLTALGKYFIDGLPSQEEIDSIIERELFKMSKDQNPALVNTKIQEALNILKQIGMPRMQLNERSALTLLALLNLKPNDKWSDCKTPLIGITPIMDFIKLFYGKEYAPNTRETIRRQTVHQFVQAGMVIVNPDKYRATNSPLYVYQVEQNSLELIKSFKTKSWENSLKNYLSTVETLSSKYAQERERQMIPLTVSENIEINLSPG